MIAIGPAGTFQAPKPRPCPYCGKERPPGYDTCGSSECQERSYREWKAEKRGRRRRKK